MSFDPQREDYQRLGLRFARTLDNRDPFGAARAASTFSRRFAQNRDSLPQSDGDRAFHLVAVATDLIDYQLPFASETAGDTLVQSAEKLLDEAIDLDERCHDARRMASATRSPSFEEFYRFLDDGRGAVREDCLRERDATSTGRRDALARDLAMRPYLRWATTESGKALICGRYATSLAIAREVLAEDPLDQGDVRFTAALALAKLEDHKGLDELVASTTQARASRVSEDAWTLLARVALGHKRRDFSSARDALRELLVSYPHAAATLTRQDELPDGVFSRLAVAPASEDELILAVSEATVLLEEGRGPQDGQGSGPLGEWIAHEPLVTEALSRDHARTGERHRMPEED